MTREEQIRCAGKDYVNYILDKQEYHNEDYTEDDIWQAFEKGAVFVNNNPDLSSLWHDASEEPKIGKQVLGIDYDGEAGSGTFDFRTVSGIFNYYELILDWDSVVRWAYIEDLLPKGGDE